MARTPLSADAPLAPFSLDTAEDRLAWIFGSSRSGSTWLLRMLSSLDAVVPIDDPHLGHHLGVWRPISLAWATAEHPPDLTTLDRLKHDKDSYFFSDRYRAAWAPALRQLIVDRFDAQVADTVDTETVAEPVVVVKEPGSHVAEAVPAVDKGESKEIRSATPGGWRESLTSAEHDVMHEVMGPKLAELGYLESHPVGVT
jgi:hypothetical protein